LETAGRARLCAAKLPAGAGAGGVRHLEMSFHPPPSHVIPRRNFHQARGQACPGAEQRNIYMAVTRTLSIIKPDATNRNLTGKINAKFEQAGLRIVAQKRIHMTKAQAGKFYEVHAARPFYDELTSFMSSAPVVVQVLEGEDAVLANRTVMGATNPADADDGTIRKEFALSLGENSVHGSDSDENAAIEIGFFFAATEIVG
jgi:nucleoside-diphosphate kinase